jgi:hypothetical protein
VLENCEATTVGTAVSEVLDSLLVELVVEVELIDVEVVVIGTCITSAIA